MSDDELAYMAEHLGEWRRSVAEGRIRYQILWTGLGIGLAVHVLGFLLKTSAPDDPMALLADLLYTLGFALWTGVVVVALTEIIPAAKERQISRALDAYEKAVRARARSNRDAGASARTGREQ